MKTVNIHFAKTHLSRLIEEAAGGEDVVIAKAGKPLVRLVAVTAASGPRILGQLKGRVKESKAAWEIDEDIEASFYQSPVEPDARPVRRVAERARKK